MEPLSAQRGLDKTGNDHGWAKSFAKRLWLQFLTRPRRVALVIVGGIVVSVIGELIEYFWVKGVGSVVVEVGAVLVWPGGILLLLSLVRQALPDGTSRAAQVMTYVATLLFLEFSGLVLAAVATTGDSTVIGAVLHGKATSSAWLAVGSAFVIAIPMLVVVTPEALRRYRPWDKASDLAKTLVPAWLSAAAAVATFAYVVVEHFFGAALAGKKLPEVLVGGLAAAALLAPAYQFMARSCWEYQDS